ncbi:Siroheme synthase (precorrin-2 oxidase/ferrochelatase domain) [Halorhabdus sp. SVX81]|uniref:precorrin-2 dehydrogenase/sirohydrochlorin ferrochelatase family protein n=1 Tax=Halorhabdus sp. SVX81 TaxID=2978283 RepID=UPI0023DCD6BE|nr:bifunctional precorrin-2 dehydrogenase/sirohydrochlorin ferrochelatase [Halorhabdus sp. SVX81]WEL18944.1 Siroheme synthase (precorrin-2 oxidase/ferrochelatase domain) [Halorhabdus sp. SVX81]
MIPLLHDFSDSRVLVFGGGPVGARKARRFDHEAEVVVVAPQFADADFGNATLERASPDPTEVAEWLDRIEPALVVAATDDAAVNAAVERAAEDRGVLVNRADHSGERAPGAVVLPAIVRDDPVVVGISTQGGAPAVSGVLREEIEREIDGAGALAGFVGDLREEFADQGVDGPHRRDALRAIARSDRIRTLVADGQTDQAREVAEELLGEVRNETES